MMKSLRSFTAAAASGTSVLSIVVLVVAVCLSVAGQFGCSKSSNPSSAVPADGAAAGGQVGSARDASSDASVSGGQTGMTAQAGGAGGDVIAASGGSTSPADGGAGASGAGGTGPSHGGTGGGGDAGAGGISIATGGASGRGGDSGSAAAAGAGPGPTGGSAWPAVSDYAVAGPFATLRQNNTGPAGAYDVFRPMVLGEQGRKHPVISWANGTLYSIDDYSALLLHWASHGFVVIAGHTNTTAGGATHKAGIDWLVGESKSATSPFFGVLDVAKIGAAGHSQGGGATIAAGANKPGTTGIVVTLPLMPILNFETDKTIVAHQLVPMFNVNATMDKNDPTGAFATQIYDGAVTELVQASFIGLHTDAMNAKMHAPTVAWFRWRLMGDAQARATFYPVSTCGLCKDADWMLVRYKNPAP